MTGVDGEVRRERLVRWEDPLAALQRAAGMSRDELLAAFASDDFPEPPIASMLDFHVVEVQAGRAVLALRPAEFHCNSMGVIAAGVTATVLDAAMWIAVQAGAAEGTLVSTVNFNVHLLRQLPPSLETVRAEAEAIHIGRSTSAAEARLVDDAGKVYAHATSGLVALSG
jgi:uncharacterized protein (TIGR00369 family)